MRTCYHVTRMWSNHQPYMYSSWFKCTHKHTHTHTHTHTRTCTACSGSPGEHMSACSESHAELSSTHHLDNPRISTPLGHLLWDLANVTASSTKLTIVSITPRPHLPILIECQRVCITTAATDLNNLDSTESLNTSRNNSVSGVVCKNRQTYT